jgi:riboflavin biosynthesis pyrimidine reductase
VRQIFPATAASTQIGPAVASAVTALARLYAYPDAAGRAWTRANMIASVDGAATLAGRSGGLSGPGDRQLFTVLRSLADVILVGAGTARAERYRPVRAREAWPALRAGRPPTPPIAVLSRALDLDTDGPLLAGPADAARTIVLTTQAAPAERRAAAARHADVIVAGKDVIAPAAAIDALAERGYRRILLEGGPALLGQIADAGLLDELCLTVTPLLAGGLGGRIIAAPGRAPAPRDTAARAVAARTAAPQTAEPQTAEPQSAGPQTATTQPGFPIGLSLGHVLEDDGYLLCRYVRLAG